ncbi:alpha/beta hydrolase-fold protein [Nocardia sp. N2S4-5]|uniref:alpha/beta hydrolase-fold protein n=1 Tax=Nocardia sp. N2S4-5 TaxID=3351565 RepID=UPI0037D5A9BC
MMPHEARSLCLSAEKDAAVRHFRHRGIDAHDLARLLRRREPLPPRLVPTEIEVEDGAGGTGTVAVHVPSRTTSRRDLGALIVLHGAGGSGDRILPAFAALGERLSMAVLCPTATSLPPGAANLDLAGLFGKRFTLPRWDLAAPGLPMAALRWARAELDVDPDRCVLAGVSMGGLAAWNLGLRYWDQFAAAVPLNGALSVWESFGTDRRTRALLENALALPLFVVHGGRDEQIPPRSDRESVAELRRLGHSCVEYAEVPDGEHQLSTLGLAASETLHERLAAWLRMRRRRSQPSELRHRADADHHGRAHWVRLHGISGRAQAEVRARRTAHHRLDVEVRGADYVTVDLTGRWFEPGAEVTVSVNGTDTVVRFEPDLETVIGTYRESADSGIFAEQSISLPVRRSDGAYIASEMGSHRC